MSELYAKSKNAYPDQVCSHQDCGRGAYKILPTTNNPVCEFHFSKADKVHHDFEKSAEFGGSNVAMGKGVSFPRIKR